MKYREPRYRAGKRDVKPPQAIGLAGSDPARFDQHDMVEASLIRKPGVDLGVFDELTY